MFLIVFVQLTFLSPRAVGCTLLLLLGLDFSATRRDAHFCIIMSNYMDSSKDYCRKLRSNKRFVSLAISVAFLITGGPV